ncbi:hypothetical protein ABPG72_003274 [Tetrahymena utriculariae]
MTENLQREKKVSPQDKSNQINEMKSFSRLKIIFSKFISVDLFYTKLSSLFSFYAKDQNGQFIQITQNAQKIINKMLKQYQIIGNQKQKNLEKQISNILNIEKGKCILDLKKCFLQGGGNFLSNNYDELKQKKDQNINIWLEEKEDEDQQKSCIYVKDCIKELKEMIKNLTELRSNTKTYSYQKLKTLNQAFFENPECYPLLLQFLELSADRLLFYMNQEKFVVTENQKNEFIKLIDDQIQVLQSFQLQEPLQNHIFYFKLIRNIFTTSKSIETTSQVIVKSGQTLLQVLTVAYKIDKQALKQLIDKCRNVCSAYRNCNKIGGIIKYNETVLCKLEDSLPLNSLSTQSSFSSQDYSRKSTSTSSQSENMQNSLDLVKQQNFIQYELELQIRHESIDTKSHFRIQYYALMQIDKLIQQMKEDPGYQINQNTTYFQKFIKNNDNGIISYSERQYFFRQLENFAFERNILLRYISLSILIRCYELFMQKCPNYPLLQEIIDAIYYRYYFEVHQKIYILISKNKDLLKQIKNKDRFEKQNQLKKIANQASFIIQQQNNQKSNYNEQLLDFDQQSMSQQSQQEDLDMMRSRIDQIKNTQDEFLQSRIAQQIYIQQEYNMLLTLNTPYLDLFSTDNAQIPILKTLLDHYFKVREVSNKRAIIVQGVSGSGKTSLALQIHQTLIQENKKQIDAMLNQSKQSQSCIVSFGQKTIIYTPILLKLQNMNLTNKQDLQNLFDSQLSEIMQNLEYKVLIIDGLNDQNYNNLSQILKSQIKDKKKLIFLITSTCNNDKKLFIYNSCVMKFLESLEIKIADIDGLQIEKLITNQQIKKFIDIQNLNKEKQFNNEAKCQFNNQKNYHNQNIQSDEKLKEIITRYQNPLQQNPQHLYQIYVIWKYFYKPGDNLQLSENEIHEKFFNAQFYGSFSYFQQISEKQQIVQIFQKAYFLFFKNIAGYMKFKEQNFITLETVQNQIVNQLSKQLDDIYNMSYQHNCTNDKEHYQDLKEYFINQLTNYYNKQILEKLNFLTRLDDKENTESLTFKQESYFCYFLNYKQE